MREPSLARSILLAVGLVAGPGLALDPPGAGDILAASSDSAVEKTAEGRVTEYSAGHAITVRMDGGRMLTVRLDEANLDAKVAPGLNVGSRVRIVESRRADGKRSVSVTVLAASSPGR